MCSGSHQMSPVAKSPLSGDRLFFWSSHTHRAPRILYVFLELDFNRAGQ